MRGLRGSWGEENWEGGVGGVLDVHVAVEVALTVAVGEMGEVRVVAGVETKDRTGFAAGWCGMLGWSCVCCDGGCSFADRERGGVEGLLMEYDMATVAGSE